MSDDDTYGTCENCGLVVPTKEDSQRHQKETLELGSPDEFGNRRSHTILLHKPSRQARAMRHVHDYIEEGLDELRDSISHHDFAASDLRDALSRIDLVSMWDEAGGSDVG